MEFIVVGGVIFWITVAVCALLLLLLLSSDSFVWSLTVVVVFLVLIHIFGDASLGTYIAHNPYKAIVFCLGWVAVGVVFSFFKWDRFNAKSAKKFREEKEVWLIQHGLNPDDNVPDNLRDEWQQWVRDHYGRYHNDQVTAKDILPKLSYNKMRIISWTAYWPLFMVLYFVEDFLVEFWHRVYEMFYGVYKRIQERWERKVEGDL